MISQAFVIPEHRSGRKKESEQSLTGFVVGIDIGGVVVIFSRFASQSHSSSVVEDHVWIAILG